MQMFGEYGFLLMTRPIGSIGYLGRWMYGKNVPQRGLLE